MIRLLKNRTLAKERLGVAQWFELCTELHRHGLLMCFAATIEAEAPSIVAAQVRDMHAAHLQKMRLRVESLKRFDAESKKLDLRYVLFKGMADSSTLYGDPFVRDSGDIDILVDPDDLPKADYAARCAGWVQPAEAFRVRRVLDNCAAGAQNLLKESCPYLLRSSRFLPHVTNHYYVHENSQVDSMEIHDRFHGLGSEACSSLLWSAVPMEIGELEFCAFPPIAGFVLSALSLYEDSESVRSNTFSGGDLGLKTCEDLHYWIMLLEQESLYEEAKALIASLGVSRKVAVSLSALLELHPEDLTRIGLLGRTEKSAWRSSYLERSLNPAARACEAVELLRERVLGSSDLQVVFAASKWSCLQFLPSYGSCLRSPFLFALENNSTDDVCCALEWSLPLACFNAADSLVFQAVVVFGQHGTQGFGFRINCFQEEGKWTARAIAMGPDFIDGHANKIKRGFECSVEAEYNAECTRLRIPLDLLLDTIELCIPSVNTRIYGELFRPCAGWDFLEEASAAMGIER